MAKAFLSDLAYLSTTFEQVTPNFRKETQLLDQRTLFHLSNIPTL